MHWSSHTREATGEVACVHAGQQVDIDRVRVLVDGSRSKSSALTIWNSRWLWLSPGTKPREVKSDGGNPGTALGMEGR
jgi:hypothetical protein